MTTQSRNSSISSDKPLERYVQIMEMLAAFPDELNLADLATALELPKSTVHRLLKGLIESNAVVTNTGRSTGYRLGPRIVRMLHSASGAQELELFVQQPMQELADTTNVTCYLVKMAGTRMRSVVMRMPPSALCICVMPGSEMAAHATASGKAIAAFQEPDVLKLLLPDPLPAFTSRTKTDRAAVLRELEEVRRDRIAFCRGEDIEGYSAMSCPIEINGIGVIYSIGLAAPTDLVFGKNTDFLVQELKKMSVRLSSLISVATTVRQTRKDHVPAADYASSGKGFDRLLTTI